MEQLTSILILIALLHLGNAKIKETPPIVPTTITVQATNFTQVPSVTYIVDAVHCLEEAYSIYDNEEARALLYSELFQEKHNGTWDVIVGYSAIYIHSEIYVETIVTSSTTKKEIKKGDDDDDSLVTKFLIFTLTNSTPF